MMVIRDGIHIVMFSAEAAPFVKVGGLADVIGALPGVLESQGARVTIVLPDYQAVAHESFGISPCPEVPPFEVPVGTGSVRTEVFQTRLPGTNVRVFFLRGGGFFSRPGIYDDPKTREGYPDNMQRFAFYARAGLELLTRLAAPVHVVHCHDSQTGMVPGLMRTVYRDHPFFRNLGCLFTIHNLAYQGLYEKEALTWAGIDPGLFYPMSPFEYWGQVNFMKIGIMLADLVSTVSRTYAREIQSGPEFGCGLEGVLRDRSADLYGIPNGIDYEEWNPETDSWIPAPYNTEEPNGKIVCKAVLLAAMGLPQPRGRVPLIGIISRLADQKGFDLIGEAMPRIAQRKLQMVVLGTGQLKYHELFQEISRRYPEKIAVRLAFDNGLAHRIEAGADMFLMPSRYEPCGLNQLYSMRYGTVPIVRATGGLADTVTDFDPEAGSGTGFVFREYSAAEMLSAVDRALSVYSQAGRWRDLMVRGMTERWSWEESARQYMELYDKIIKRRHP